MPRGAQRRTAGEKRNEEPRGEETMKLQLAVRGYTCVYVQGDWRTRVRERYMYIEEGLARTAAVHRAAPVALCVSPSIKI